jgi:hypothetical protein
MAGWQFPIAPTLNTASPVDGSTVCAGFNTGTVTGNAGSGGSTGAADEYQLSIDGGLSYNPYTSGNAITTTGATGNIIVQSRRTGGSYGCGNSAWGTICTWTLSGTPTADAGSDQSTCDNTSININGASATNYTSISWYIVSGCAACSFTGGTETTLTPEFNPDVTGLDHNVVIQITVNGYPGCTVPATSTKNVMIYATPNTSPIQHD